MCSNEGNLDVFFHTCGVHNFTLYGITDTAKDKKIKLSSKAVELPVYTPLVLSKKRATWVSLKFNRKMENCFPDRRYSVNCGNWTLDQVEEEETIVVSNLFPGKKYSCTYERKGLEQTQLSVDFWTEQPIYKDVSPFSASSEAIFLINDLLEELLSDPSIKVTVMATNVKTGATSIVSGEVAVSQGIEGLQHASVYKVCVAAAQLKSHYTLEREEWCHHVSTLPQHCSHSGSLVGIWIILSILVVVILALVVYNFRKTDPVRSFSQYLPSVLLNLSK